jgi:hypothetical protein
LIRAPKTDRDALGEYVPVKAGQHLESDPVALLRGWTAALAELGVAPGFLLRAVNQHDALFPHGFMALPAPATHRTHIKNRLKPYPATASL